MMRTFFATVFLAVGVLAGQAFGDWDIRIYDSSDQLVASYADWQIETAITNLAEGQRMELHPGKVFKPTSQDYFYFRGKRNVTINGGSTCRVTKVTDYLAGPGKIYYTVDGVHGGTPSGDIPVVGDKIKFRGAAPPPLSVNTQYYVAQVSTTAGWFRVTTTEGATDTADCVQMTGSVPADELCYGYNHAILEPRSSTTTHKYLVMFVDNTTPNPDVITHSPTIKNLTIDGRGYQSTDYGGGMILSSQSGGPVTGTVTVSGVHVEDLRGVDEGGPDKRSLGISFSNCDTVNVTNCTASNTAYAAWKTNKCGNVVYDYCRAVNPMYRVFAEDTSAVRTPFGTIQVKNSVFKRTSPNTALSGSTDTFSLLGNWNPKNSARLSSVTIDNCFVDWRDCEGTGYSWNFAGTGDTCLLAKFEGIDTLTVKNSKFYHGKNKNSSNQASKGAASLKLDPKGADDLILEDCEFSAGIYASPGQPETLDEFRVTDCVIAKHGAMTGTQKIPLINNMCYKVVDFDGVVVENIDYICFGFNDRNFGAIQALGGGTWTFNTCSFYGKAGNHGDKTGHTHLFVDNSSGSDDVPLVSELNAHFTSVNSFCSPVDKTFKMSYHAGQDTAIRNCTSP